MKMTMVLCAGIFLSMVLAGESHETAQLGLGNTKFAAPVAAPIAAMPEVARGGFTPTDLPAIAEPLPGVPAVLAEPMPPFHTPEPVVTAPPVADPVRYVGVAAVNVRGGPSTGHPVLGRLTRGDAALVLGTADGWAHILIEGDGVDGYVAAKFLFGDPAP